MTHATILGIDASSTSLGWVVYDASARDCGEFQLTGDIASRCRQAYAALGLILITHPDIDAIALESPVSRFAKAVIPQARVSGALLVCASLKQLHVVEVAPQEAKKALTGSGCAGKLQMQAEALTYGVVGEHAADALGVAISAAQKVTVVAMSEAA
jgi:Holliday junction resolvasome RuvABC endonuclease subunit